MSIKHLAIAATAIALTASGASAANTFGLTDTLHDTNSIELPLVNAAADGVVEIYNLKAGEQGKLLGSTTVNAGANGDVRINVGHTFKTDVLAVLKVDGQVVATDEINISR